VRTAALLALAMLMACSHDAAPEMCPPERLSPDQVCLGAPCAAGEVRIDGVCSRVGNDRCADGFVAEPGGGCASTLPASCDEPRVAFPGETSCHALDDCPPDRFVAVEGTAVYVDSTASEGGDGSAGKPLRTIMAAVARARDTATPSVVVAAGTYAERLLLDTPITVRGVCSAKVVLAPPLDDLGETTVRATADATLSGLSVLGKEHALAFTAIGGASLSLEHVRVRGHRRAIEIMRAATPRVPHLRLHDVSIGGADLAITTQIPIEAKRLHVRQSSAAMAIQADGTIESSVIEDIVEFGIGVDSAHLDVVRSVVRRVGQGSSTGGHGIALLPPRATGESEVTVSGCVLSEIEGVGIGVQGGRAVVRETTVRDGVMPAGGGNLAAGLGVLGHGAIEAENTTLLHCAYTGAISNGGPITLTRVHVRDVVGDDSAIGVTLLTGDVDGAAVLRGVLVEHTRNAGLYVYGRKVTVLDSRFSDIMPRIDGKFGDGITANDDFKFFAVLDITNVEVDGAARAALSLFGSAARVRSSRLCGAFSIDASEQTFDKGSKPFTLTDGGGNVCGCGAPLTACRVSQSNLEPLPPPL